MTLRFGLRWRLLLVVLTAALIAFASGTSTRADGPVLVNNLQPSWSAPGGGGVYAGYYGPPAYSAVSPGATAVFDGRQAGIIKAGLNIDADGHYWDEGLFAFIPNVTIDAFAAGVVSYDAANEEGTNPVWMTIEIDTDVVGDRSDNTTYQFVPTTNPAGWHTVNAAAGMWQQWADSNGTVTGPLMTLAEVAAAHPGLNVIRAYLRLGMGDSYHGTGAGTVAWVDAVTLGGVTYDFVIEPVVPVSVLDPSYTAPGGGGVFSAYIGPPDYGYVSPGATALYDGRTAGIIKAGLLPDPGDGHYWDEGLFAFRPTVTIDEFAQRTLTYVVENQEGTNPVWMTIEIDTGVVGDRGDNVTYQFVPTTNPAGWHTVNAAAGQWQQWADSSGTVTGPLVSLPEIAAAYPGLNVVRTYLRLGMGDSYHGSGLGTVAWVDKATLGGLTYDFLLEQSITFDPLVGKTYGDPDFTVSASASSWLPVTFAASGNCTVAGATVHLTGAGSCTITASQAGDETYGPAQDVSQTFSIAKAAATLALGSLTQVYDGAPKPVTVTTTPPGLSGVSATYDGSPTAPTNPGSYAVVATLTNPDYEASPASGTLVIVDSRTSQTIVSAVIPDKDLLSPDFLFSATASSGLQVTFSPSGPCTVYGDAFASPTTTTMVHVTGVGSCTIAMVQAGSADYSPGYATRSFAISKVSQTITFAALATKYISDGDFTVTAAATSGLTVSFTATTAATCSVTLGGLVHMIAPGTCTIVAAQTGDAIYAAAPAVARSFTIKAAIALYSLSLSPSKCIGGCANANGKVTLNAVTPTAQTVTLTSSNGAVAAVPPTVTVLAGMKTATFVVATSAVPSSTPVTITATLGIAKSKTLTVKPVTPLSVSLAPQIVTIGGGSTGTVTLSCPLPASAGTLTVNLTSLKPALATVPLSITFTTGEQSKTFPVATTGPITSTTTVTIKATANGVTKSTVLTINP